MPTPTQLCFGRPTPPAAPLLLRAGPLTLWFEKESLFLRRVLFGQTEILRAIYGAVRDRNWGTVPHRIEDFSIQRNEASFQLDFTAVCAASEIDYAWKGRITGNEQGRLEFQFDGLARSSFMANRIGLCVLHPIGTCAGRSCQIEHVDGSVSSTTFPEPISPHQPFKNVRAIRYAATDDLEVSVRFEGDVFETEDQRNWTDASYKTYSRPLQAPFPFPVENGAAVHQSIILELTGHHKPLAASLPRDVVELELPAKPLRHRPPVGLCLTTSPATSAPAIPPCIDALGLDHLRIDLHLNRDDWRAELRSGLQAIRKLTACRLHVALFLTDAAKWEIAAFCCEIQRELDREQNVGEVIGLWLLHPETSAITPESCVHLATQRLQELDANIPIAAGTNANFAELNRHRPTIDCLPCFSINPQVHTNDDLSLFENLEAQPDTVATTRQFCTRSVVISPITLRPRFNAVATEPEAAPRPNTLPPQVDPRQMSLVGAAWTLGSLARLSSQGSVHSLTYFQTTGWLGVMENAEGSKLPETFPSWPNCVFPMYHVFAWLAGFSRTAPVRISNPSSVAALAVFDENAKSRVLIANLTAEDQTIQIPAAAGSATWSVMDAHNVILAMTEPATFQSQAGRIIRGESNRLMFKLAPYAAGTLSVG